MVSASVFVACFLLFSCVSEMQASVLNLRELKAAHEGAKKFKLRIMERGTRFYEKVDIDEDGQLAYFNVPAHNGLQATEELYDFKMNITIRRSKVDGVCYVKPLPEDVPRPKELTTAFSEAANRPPNYRISTISKYWTPSEEVDKSFLRREAREFCDQYPIYRLEEYKPDSVLVEKAGRSRRTIKFKICPGHRPPVDCNNDDMVFNCDVTRSGNCVYIYVCRLNRSQKILDCKEIDHRYDSLICCRPSCP